MTPACHMNAEEDKRSAAYTWPITCPRSLMPSAMLLAPPRSIITPSCQTNAPTEESSARFEPPTTWPRALMAYATVAVPPSEPRSVTTPSCQMNPPCVESSRSEAPTTWLRKLIELATLAPPPRCPRSVTDEYCPAAGSAWSSAVMSVPTNTLHGSRVRIGASFRQPRCLSYMHCRTPLRERFEAHLGGAWSQDIARSHAPTTDARTAAMSAHRADGRRGRSRTGAAVRALPRRRRPPALPITWGPSATFSRS